MSVLALDLGTGSVKVALVSDDLVLLHRASRAYPVHAEEPGAATADCAQWARAVESAVAQVLGADPTTNDEPVRAVGVSGQMHGLVLLTSSGEAAGPALLWPDTRATAEVETLAGAPVALRSRLANPFVPGMAGPLLAYWTRTRPDVLRRAAFAVQPKDWLRTAISGAGAACADPSDASATLLWDVPADRWAPDAARLLGIDGGLLPQVRASREVVGHTTGALGLPPGLPVVAGAADTACAALGTGTVRPGRGQLSVGTGAQILVPLDRSDPLVRNGSGAVAPVTHTYRDAADGWYRMGAVQNCGLAMERVLGWLGATWSEALAALRSAPGVPAGGPVFLPYLSGERTPWLDPHLRGAWVGLGLEHDRADLLRSALVGVACAVADAWDAVLATGVDAGVPLLVGGGSMDAGWRQLLADVIGTPLRPAAAPDAGVLGAAALALDGVGLRPSGDAASLLEQRAGEQGAGPDEVVEPAAARRDRVAQVRADAARARLALPAQRRPSGPANSW